MDAASFTLGGAALIAITHTIAGPDHYLPFIVMSKARNWSIWKTSWITALCGLGHVASTIILGAIAYLALEDLRGDIAAWGFIIFGGAYMTWGIRSAILNKPHKHLHIHTDGSIHTHEHNHQEDHSHVHNKKLTPWILFVIFFLGPCEAMLIYFPASNLNTSGDIFVGLIAVFSIVTIITMLVVVLLTVKGLNLLPFQKLERYMHASAGFIIMFSGIAIKFLGL